MSTQRITLIDQGRQVVATAQVAEQDGTFVGRINLSPMPMPLRQLFEEYEEIVHTQTFSLLDEIEEKIETLHLKAVFEDGHEAALTDVQIYPRTNRVSCQVLKRIISRPGVTYERALMEIDFSRIKALVERPGESRHCSRASEIGIDKASDGVYITGPNLLSQETISCSAPVNMSLTPRRVSSTPTTCLSPL